MGWLIALLAVGLFPARAQVNMAGVQRVAVISGRLIAMKQDGSGTVLVPDGEGTFQVAGTFSSARNPSGIAVADLDGDGHRIW